MKLPAETVIATEKLRDYLLRSREDHDKAGFLAVAGYEAGLHERLEADLRSQLLPLEAEVAEQTAYGQKFIIRGKLTGPNGRSLRVLSVWMLDKATGLNRFITLYPSPK